LVTVGLLSVGDVPNTKEPEPVSSVTAVARLADDGVAKKVATPEPRPDTPVEIGKPVQFVNVPLVGVPKSGVTSVGDVANTSDPLPVSSVTAEAKLADDGVAKNVATPVPSPLIPVDTGSPVQFVSVPDVGVPSAGVTSVGDVANTSEPEPVSSVTADARLAEDGVAKNVATPVPKPLTPVLIGKPVALVSVPLDGVPNAPPLTTTAPAEPTFMPRAVKTPVPVAVPESAFVPL